jgi:hypothetical protein
VLHCRFLVRGGGNAASIPEEWDPRTPDGAAKVATLVDDSECLAQVIRLAHTDLMGYRE